MTPMRIRMIEDMKLAGLADRTQQVYVQAVANLAKYYRRSPEHVTEEEVRRYLLDLREQGAARGTFKTCHYGIQFFYRHTLGKDWTLFKKRSGCRNRSDFPRLCPTSRFGASWPISAILSTAPALP
jgi:site-specific recombinase XerD